MKLQEIYEKIINEINMSPGSLRSLVKNINARAGMEFELIVPNVNTGDDSEMEPDFDEDQRTRSFGDIEGFFDDGEYNSSRAVERALQRIRNEFWESMDDQMFDDWQDNMFESVRDYVVNNLDDDEVKEELDLPEDHELTKEDWTNFTDKCIEEENEWYERAREDYEEDWRQDVDEESWLSRNYPMMSSISDNFDLTWPYWSNSSDGEMDIAAVAEEFENMIGKTVHWSASYHGGKREPDAYTVEPDSSLDADSSYDGGLEFISPPMSVDEMLSDLDKIVAWAKQYGAYTNSSTGLHMNISVPDMSTAKLDFVKLALLLGDEYVLEQFGRMSNTYAKSAMKIVRDRVRERPEDAEAMLRQMKEHLGALATKVIHSGETSKYTSINTKGNYVEFRSPGGDWLTGAGEDNLDKVKSTLLRFVVALDAAMDPEKYRQEYLKKLYKLFDIKKENDTLSYFAKYSAGELPQSALKSFVKQAQLERNLKKGNVGGEKFWWEVKRPGYMASIEVVATSKEEAIRIATQPENYPDWANAANLEVKPLRPYSKEPVKATAGEPQPAGETGSIKYALFNRTTDQVYREFWAANDDMAREIGNRYREEIRAQNPDVSLGLRRASTTPATGGEGSRNYWSQTDIENRLGWGSQAADANYEVVDRGNNRSVFKFIANTPQEAQRKYGQVLDVFGFPHDTENYGFRELVVPGSTVDLQRQRAAQAQSGGGEFTGWWIIKSPEGRELHRFNGIGNAQSDANRVAIQWLRSHPEDMRDGVEVVPEMR